MNNAKMPDVSCYVISTPVGSDKRKIENGRISPFLVFQVLGKKRFWCCFKISWMLSNFKHWPPRLDVVIRYLSFELLNTIDSTLYGLYFCGTKNDIYNKYDICCLFDLPCLVWFNTMAYQYNHNILTAQC